jgi:two-component system CheB/CheR fusion protein
MTARPLVTKTESPSLVPTDKLAQALQTQIVELARLNNDLNHLLEGAGIGAIFVDSHMRILRFTATASQLINLIPSDVGRTLDDIVTNLMGSDHLVVDVQAVLDTQTPRNVQVQTARFMV